MNKPCVISRSHDSAVHVLADCVTINTLLSADTVRLNKMSPFDFF